MTWLSLSLAMAAPQSVTPPDLRGDAAYLIVACSLSKYSRKPEAKIDERSHKLNLLIRRKSDAQSNFPVIDTFDPDNVSVTGPFKKAGFERSVLGAWTGDPEAPTTRILTVLPGEQGRRESWLWNTAKRGDFFLGRCGTVESKDAAAEFEALKIKDAVQ